MELFEFNIWIELSMIFSVCIMIPNREFLNFNLVLINSIDSCIHITILIIDEVPYLAPSYLFSVIYSYLFGPHNFLWLHALHNEQMDKVIYTVFFLKLGLHGDNPNHR